MYRLVVFVLNNPKRGADVLAAWKAAGVSGATVVEGVGLGHLLGYLREDTPLFPSRSSLSEGHNEVSIVFAVTDDSVNLDALIARTEAVVGNLDTPNTGILMTLPIETVKGLRRQAKAP
ncbi:MAG TPA: hypothetical protein VER55_17125 [Ardenticatenaceae bacterium]|nr:hypothetical protein [Ardenticatenaceae bacterium]